LQFHLAHEAGERLTAVALDHDFGAKPGRAEPIEVRHAVFRNCDARLFAAVIRPGRQFEEPEAVRLDELVLSHYLTPPALHRRRKVSRRGRGACCR
jgi:hypothetical protein